MRRLLVPLVSALLVAGSVSPAVLYAQQPACAFKLGFATLRDLIVGQYGDIVGRCLEDERFEPSTGNALQRSSGGLLVWRKADNWTAFTDGARTS